jgi:hypothetical protein
VPNQTSFETTELRRMLKSFLEKEVIDPITHANVKIGNYKFGVYAFFDYDLEPIYDAQMALSHNRSVCFLRISYNVLKRPLGRTF